MQGTLSETLARYAREFDALSRRLIPLADRTARAGAENLVPEVRTARSPTEARRMMLLSMLRLVDRAYPPKPGPPAGRGVTVASVLDAIAKLGLGDEATQEAVADRLGVSDRHLRSVCRAYGGWAAVLAEAKTRR